jgi:sugar phosphate isomerase/epimerase
MKLTLCNEIFQDFPLEKQFATAAELGFAAIELSPFTLAPSVREITAAQREQIRALAAATGLEVAGIHWLLAKTEGFHLTHPDPEVRARTVAYLEDLVRFGVEVGGKIAVVGSPQQRSLLPGVTYAQAWEWFREALIAAASVEGAEQFTLCIEPLAPKTNNSFLFNAAEAVRLAREINLPNVGVVIDCYSAVDMEIDLPHTLQATGPWLRHVHLNDDNGRAPGYGSTDFGPIMGALVARGYEGYASLEVFDFSIDPVEHARRGLETVREALALEGPAEPRAVAR